MQHDGWVTSASVLRLLFVDDCMLIAMILRRILSVFGGSDFVSICISNSPQSSVAQVMYHHLQSRIVHILNFSNAYLISPFTKEKNRTIGSMGANMFGSQSAIVLHLGDAKIGNCLRSHTPKAGRMITTAEAYSSS